MELLFVPMPTLEEGNLDFGGVVILIQTTTTAILPVDLEAPTGDQIFKLRAAHTPNGLDIPQINPAVPTVGFVGNVKLTNLNSGSVKPLR